MSKSEVNFYWEKPIDPLLIKVAWEDAFSRKISNEQWIQLWDWRFKNNPFSDKILASYYFENDEIASFVAFSPVLIKYQNTCLNAALGISGFTNPKYYGMGYYSMIYNALIEQMRSLDYIILFGFDNHNSHYPEVKYLGWKDLGLLTEFSLLSSKVKQKFDHNSRYKVIFEELSEDIVINLSNMETTNKMISFQRDYEFLKWRLINNPLNHYFSCNCYDADYLLVSIVIKKYKEHDIDIMEIFYKKDILQDKDIIIKEIILYLLENGLNKINIWSNLNSEEHLLLEKIGFMESIFNSYFVYYPINTLYDNININNFHYRFIDSDVY